MSKDRVAIFIDGSNLYYKLKELKIQHTTEFNYLGLCQKLARQRPIVFKGYFIGVVRVKGNDPKSLELRKNQQRLFSFLRNRGFIIRQGYLLENNGKYHEKGVDVQLATDLLIGAYEDKYDVAIILSSDTDMLPAIRKIKSLGKRIEYIGFSHQPSLGLQRESNWSYLLPKEELEEFERKDENKKAA